MFFKHKYLTDPTVTHTDRVIQAARELYNALKEKAEHGEDRHGRLKTVREVVHIRNILEEMGHPQPPTPQYKLITQQQMELSTTRYSQKEPSQWI